MHETFCSARAVGFTRFALCLCALAYFMAARGVCLKEVLLTSQLAWNLPP